MAESRPDTSAAATRSSPPAPSCHWGSAGENEAASSFFPRGRSAPSQAETGTDLVEIADTDLETKLFLEGRLHHTAWRAGRRVTVAFQPCPLGRAQFGGVSMSSILECSFPAGAHLTQQPISCRTTDLDPGLGSSLLPPMTGLHEGNPLLFGRASLLRFHRPLLAHADFMKRLSSAF